jgi:hypothetical protein
MTGWYALVVDDTVECVEWFLFEPSPYDFKEEHLSKWEWTLARVIKCDIVALKECGAIARDADGKTHYWL